MIIKYIRLDVEADAAAGSAVGTDGSSSMTGDGPTSSNLLSSSSCSNSSNSANKSS